MSNRLLSYILLTPLVAEQSFVITLWLGMENKTGTAECTLASVSRLDPLLDSLNPCLTH